MQDGHLKPDGILPTGESLFDLDTRAGGAISLKAARGGYVVAEDRDARRVRADSPRSEPGGRELFRVIAVEGNRVALKAQGSRSFAVFSANDAGRSPAAVAPPDKPRSQEIVEIFRVVEVPVSTCQLFSTAVRGIVGEELKGKPYDKVRSHKVERSVDLPAPTLRDPLRTKSHRVLSMVEEYHVRAELNGEPAIDIVRMFLLKGYRDPAVSLLMFEVKSRLPAKGRVGYKIPGLATVSAGYQTSVKLALIGEIRLETSDDRLSLASPEVREIHVALQGLRLSNDLLNSAREPLEDLVNHELRRNEERIRQQANKSLAKAVKAREFHHPLLLFLSTP